MGGQCRSPPAGGAAGQVSGAEIRRSLKVVGPWGPDPDGGFYSKRGRNHQR